MPPEELKSMLFEEVEDLARLVGATHVIVMLSRCSDREFWKSLAEGAAEEEKRESRLDCILALKARRQIHVLSVYQPEGGEASVDAWGLDESSRSDWLLDLARSLGGFPPKELYEYLHES